MAILRDGHVMIPQPETALAAGDEVVALSSVDSEAGLRDTVMGTGERAPEEGAQNDHRHT